MKSSDFMAFVVGEALSGDSVVEAGDSLTKLGRHVVLVTCFTALVSV